MIVSGIAPGLDRPQDSTVVVWRATPATTGVSTWLAVRDEVFDVLSAVSREQMSGAAALFTDRARRWFCSGQGRSGLVAQMAAMRLMHVADSTLACLADAVIEVPTAGTGQFGGTLFEQSALLLLDAVILDLTAADPQAYAGMKARHTNLQ